MRLERWAVAMLLLMTGLSACAKPTSAEEEVIVFAAASLTDAFEDVARAFEEQHPGVRVRLNFASSSALAVQLAEGAQADVYASANPRQMNVANEAGRVEGEAATFATNRLVLIVPGNNPASITAVDNLFAPEQARLVLAAPGVPVRDYADVVFGRLSADEEQRQAVYSNLVSEEPNVRQVVTRVALGEADAGIVYATDVTPDVADKLQIIEIPEEANVTATYPIAIVSGAPHPALAEQFMGFVRGPQGQRILADWGFGPGQ